MDRRRILASFLLFPFVGVAAHSEQVRNMRLRTRSDLANVALKTALIRSGAVSSRFEGEVIENLDVTSFSGDAVTITHAGVTLRNCRIRHAGGHGVHAVGAKGVRLDSLDIEHLGAAPSGEGPSTKTNNISLEACPDAVITGVRASKGASNIYLEGCAGSTVSHVELHDARGPEPRGQNVQFNKCPGSSLTDFSAENGTTSWTEDNVSIFHSDSCTVSNGLVAYNNSPSGDGVMLEGSSDCRVEHVDAQMQGNGAFAAVPSDRRESGGCLFLRCRTAHSYNEPRDGRDAPSSNGLSFYTRNSPGCAKHMIVDCSYFALANPHNLIWERDAVEHRPVLVARAFTPRAALRLQFNWDTQD